MLGKKVLVADDAEAIRVTLKTVFNNIGVAENDVFMAEDGTSALEMYTKHRPEIVFLDLVMPGLSGEEVCRAVLKLDPLAKVILLTGSSLDDERVRRTLSDGAFDVLQKPVRLADILAVFKGIEREELGLRRVS